MKGKKRKGRYTSELEKLKRLNAINEVLKKGEIENAALTYAPKDTESAGENVIDNMLSQLNSKKHTNRDLEIIENLSSEGKNARIIKRKHVKIKRSGKSLRVKSKVHIIKRLKSSKSAKKNAAKKKGRKR